MTIFCTPMVPNPHPRQLLAHLGVKLCFSTVAELLLHSCLTYFEKVSKWAIFILIIFGFGMGNTCKSHENNDVPVNTNPPRIARWILAYKNRGETLAQKWCWKMTTYGGNPRFSKKWQIWKEIPDFPDLSYFQFSLFSYPKSPSEATFGTFGGQTFLLVWLTFVHSNLSPTFPGKFLEKVDFQKSATFNSGRDHMSRSSFKWLP